LRGSLKTLGVDDGYFPVNYKKSNKKTLLVAALCEGIKLINVKLSLITVDGLDGSDVVTKIIKSLGEDISIVFLDGVTYAGFNVVDPEIILKETSVPVITIFKHPLNLDKVKEALIRNFNDWMIRYNTIKKVYSNVRAINTPNGKLLISLWGINNSEAYNAIVKLQNISQHPEPLRIADVIASGLTKSTPLLSYLNKDC